MLIQHRDHSWPDSIGDDRQVSHAHLDAVEVRYLITYERMIGKILNTAEASTRDLCVIQQLGNLINIVSTKYRIDAMFKL